MKENDCNEDKYNENMKNSKTCPKDCPKMKKGIISSLPLVGCNDKSKFL